MPAILIVACRACGKATRRRATVQAHAHCRPCSRERNRRPVRPCLGCGGLTNATGGKCRLCEPTADRTGPVPLADAPTTALPGTPAKEAVLTLRASLGRQLFHPKDVRAEE